MTRVRIGGGQLTAEVWTLGAALNAVEVPDATGAVSSVVLGCRDEAARQASKAYLGEIVGPYGNRIANATFDLDGETYELDRNFEGKHTLHGGAAGFSRQEWDILEQSDDSVTLGLVWTDTAGSHPGTITVRASYAVDGDTLTLVTEATTDAPTVTNVVSHPYFNLGSTTVEDHVLQIAASRFVNVDAEAIPLPDAPQAVAGDLDLREGKALIESYGSSDPQLTQFGGLDHCFVLDGAGLRPVASLTCPTAGRRLMIQTDQAGLQVYGGMFLGEEPVTVGPDGAYGNRAGVALETQNLPDAPNRPDFPSSVLRPGEVQRAEVRWTFSTI